MRMLPLLLRVQHALILQRMAVAMPFGTELCTCVVQAAGVDEATSALHNLPLVDFPALGLCLAAKWTLPSRRPSTEHHLFPITPAVSSKALQLV